ncbi:hypothetical protein B0H12DRAFT_1327691 [Mycena haematopus]|nr:hypothetical protein B0H12DRAFT_1327691 [Mycena haematopus]
MIGPALPQALRVVRYPYHEYDEPYTQYKETPNDNLSAMAAACPEEPHPVIVPGDEQALLENFRMVAALEDIYSLRNKDNKSRTSVLTSEESWRFHRAMYRIMLYSELFPNHRYDNEGILDMDDEIVGKIRTQRTTVLNEYPTDELRELSSAVKFLVNIFVSVGAPMMLANKALSTGLSVALLAWRSRSYRMLNVFFEGEYNHLLFDGYFSLPLDNIYSERGITPPNAGDPASKWILDKVTSATDICSHCAAPHGIELYTEANWGQLSIHLECFLKNYLRQNPTLFIPFFEVTCHLRDFHILGPFIGVLFAFKAHTTPEFDNWERTDSYCLPCLTKFLEEHLWIWFLAERVRCGWVPPENCPYGWNCPTQAHERHAERKNHLCVPIKDVPA